MPDDRLARARPTLDPDYRFGDARYGFAYPYAAAARACDRAIVDLVYRVIVTEYHQQGRQVVADPVF